MNSRSSRGSTMIEMLVAIVVLGTALTISAQLSGLSHLQQRSADHRALALEEAANLMERITALPIDQITREQIPQWKLSDEATAGLPHARLTVDVRDEPGDLPARRVAIEIHWRNRAGQGEAPVRLTTWVYPSARPEASP